MHKHVFLKITGRPNSGRYALAESVVDSEGDDIRLKTLAGFVDDYVLAVAESSSAAVGHQASYETLQVLFGSDVWARGLLRSIDPNQLLYVIPDLTTQEESDLLPGMQVHLLADKEQRAANDIGEPKLTPDNDAWLAGLDATAIQVLETVPFYAVPNGSIVFIRSGYESAAEVVVSHFASFLRKVL